MRAEIRNPNREIRNEFQREKDQNKTEAMDAPVLNFPLCSFRFVSGFGFRISRFTICAPATILAILIECNSAVRTARCSNNSGPSLSTV